jgi:enterochelin esterase family protein
VTTPPYELGTHYYGFLVDGVTTGDVGGTARTERLPRGYFLFEQLDVRGPEALYTDIRKVPHGTVHIETFSAAGLDREVRCFVYTPPGFVAGERLPVVYLLHGTVDFESSWSVTGYAERIADNLIADGQARRMILAMPDTGTPNRENPPTTVVEPYLISEVIPFVEGKYLGGDPSATSLGSPPAPFKRAMPDFGIRRCSPDLASSAEAAWHSARFLKSFSQRSASLNCTAI